MELTRVKRLLKDPVELCCPLSHELMEDPVVAADGFTYERCWVEEAYKRAPGKSPMTGQPIATTAPWPSSASSSRPTRRIQQASCKDK